jgi:NAD(P)-dependent dehydrogenase (short-subunit alcohol dehydrogenase family)
VSTAGRHRQRRIDAPGGRWLVTGASRGLGRELARLAEDRFGAEVVGLDRTLASGSGGRRHLRADLATRDGTERALELIRDWKPTVLVNNASTNQSRRVVDTPDAMVDEIVAVGFTTPFRLMQEMARVHRGTGVDAWVINIVSPYRLVGVRTHSLYCATKAGLSRAGESLGVELDRTDSLTVVSVVPGAFNSGFRPVEAHDAWLVRTYRGSRNRTAQPVAAELMGRLRRGTRRRHWTIRLGWDGRAFELVTRIGASDLFLAALDRLIGQRPAPAPSGGTVALLAHASDRAAAEDHEEGDRRMAEVGFGDARHQRQGEEHG